MLTATVFDTISMALWKYDAKFWLWLNGAKAGYFSPLYYEILGDISSILDRIRDFCFGDRYMTPEYWELPYGDISQRIMDPRV